MNASGSLLNSTTEDEDAERMHYKTPLRYPGGKRKLANFIKLLFQQNLLLDGHYVEPYAGGAAAAMALLFEEYASTVHLNDLSRPLYAFWHCVLNETENFCRLIRDTDVTMEEWHRQRTVQEQEESASLLELGFSTFFMNRTNRSGIITGGVVGGQDQTGIWKLDARFNKKDLIRRIKKIASYRNRIRIYDQDAADFMRLVLPSLPARTLVYLDPPFYVKGQELYKNFYQHDDHILIANLVTQINQYWIVSYDNAPEIAELYRGYESIEYSLSYSASGRYRGSEIMFFSNSLSVPPVEDPEKVDNRLLNRSQIGLPLALAVEQEQNTA